MRALDLVPEAVGDYAARHTSPVPPLLEELLAATHEQMGRRALMLSGPIEGRLLQMLAVAAGARRILEVGMFTGFSALMMAEVLPDDGRLITCEIAPDAIAFARPFFARSPHGHKIEVRQGPALETLQALQGPFELVFLDADKEGYIGYYESALPLLAPNGLIVADNVLRGGGVLNPQTDNERAIVAFNDHVRNDPRVSQVILTVRDGIMLIRPRAPQG